MGKYKRLSVTERWSIIKPIIENQIPVNSISKSSGIDYTVISNWVRKFKSSGMEGLENGKGWKQYSSELKKQAVEDVMMRGMSKKSVTAKYEISDPSVLRGWIKYHNSGKGAVS